MYKETIIQNTQTENRNSATAYFSNTPVAVVSASLFTKAGDIKLNDKKVKYNNNDNFYATKIKKHNNDPDDDPNEFCNTTTMEPMHWKVKGSGNIPEMNFIYGASFPEFNNSQILPSSIKLTDTLFITLNSVSLADSIRINIFDNYFNTESRKYIRVILDYNSISVYNGNRVIYIPPALLIPLAAGGNSYISIEAVKANYQTVAGKKFLFNTITSIIKPVITITN